MVAMDGGGVWRRNRELLRDLVDPPERGTPVRDEEEGEKEDVSDNNQQPGGLRRSLRLQQQQQQQ